MYGKFIRRRNHRMQAHVRLWNAPLVSIVSRTNRTHVRSLVLMLMLDVQSFHFGSACQASRSPPQASEVHKQARYTKLTVAG